MTLPDIIQGGALGLLAAVLWLSYGLAKRFIDGALAALEALETRHREDHERLADKLDQLGARIESGRCIYRPSAGQMQAVRPPGLPPVKR